jgi:hypothetical protein
MGRAARTGRVVAFCPRERRGPWRGARRGRLALVLVALLGLSAASALLAVPASGMSEPRAATIVDVGRWHGYDPCPSALFIGARGSDQCTTADNGMGPQVNSAYSRYLTALRAESRLVGRYTVGRYPLPYAGVSVELFELIMGLFRAETPDYTISRDGGAVLLRDIVADTASRCPNTVLVLAGYSGSSDFSGV